MYALFNDISIEYRYAYKINQDNKEKLKKRNFIINIIYTLETLFSSYEY